MDEEEGEYIDEPRRSQRLQKPRRFPRINQDSWINDDLQDLKFMTYADDGVYKNEDKIDIVSISCSKQYQNIGSFRQNTGFLLPVLCTPETCLIS